MESGTVWIGKISHIAGVLGDRVNGLTIYKVHVIYAIVNINKNILRLASNVYNIF